MLRRAAHPLSVIGFVIAALTGIAWNPSLASAAFVDHPFCTGEAVFFDPSHGEDIVLPDGFKAEVFAKGLNFPTAVAFRGNKKKFDVFVLESGTGLPGRCNNNPTPNPFGGKFSATNPFTPDIVVFDQDGTRHSATLGKPAGPGNGFQPDGPAIGLAFEKGFKGGTLFATDSNQGVRGAVSGGGNNTSRIVTVDTQTGTVTPFITGLPTGDHPTEQILVRGNHVIWSQGSATNSGVTGHDNGGGGNQHDIACQDIVLSNNVFDSGDHLTSGFSNHGVQRPGATVKAFEDATRHGMCTGAILRARIDVKDPAGTIEPIAWGFRNPFGIAIPPDNHPLKGCIFVTENGEDERGARPTNNAPDRLQCAKMNPDGIPQFHGWPDRFGFLDSTQAVFNPVGGPGDDLPAAEVIDPTRANPDVPVRHVLASAPGPIIAPLAIEPADVAVVGPDFVPHAFAHGPVRRGAALVAREGDFGFSKANGKPEEGHDVQLVNFSRKNEALELELSRFAFNTTFEQAFVDHLRGINRPVDIKFGPDMCAYLVDYGAVRDFGQSDPDSKFQNPADAPLVQIPGTGVIWKFCPTAPVAEMEDED